MEAAAKEFLETKDSTEKRSQLQTGVNADDVRALVMTLFLIQQAPQQGIKREDRTHCTQREQTDTQRQHPRPTKGPMTICTGSQLAD